MSPEDREFIKAQFDALGTRLGNFRENTAARDRKLSEKVSNLRQAVNKLPKAAATKKDVEKAVDDLATELSGDAAAKRPFEDSHKSPFEDSH